VYVDSLRCVAFLTQMDTDPTMMPHVQVDRGAIKFVLSGANIMCPGLTSAGGRLSEGIAKDAVVVRAGDAHHDVLSVVVRRSWQRARHMRSRSGK